MWDKMWFEYPLFPMLLENQLQNCAKESDALPELLVRFLMESIKTLSPTSGMVSNYKMALKILSLKVASYWKWDLDKIEVNVQDTVRKDFLMQQKELNRPPNVGKEYCLEETSTPLQLQYALFHNLMCLADYPNNRLLYQHETISVEDLASFPPRCIFALTLYSRWCLRIVSNNTRIYKNLIGCYHRLKNMETAEEILSTIMLSKTHFEDILEKIVSLQCKDEHGTMNIPTMETFIITDALNFKQNWEIAGANISSDKFYCQVTFDLGLYKMYKECYKEAADLFQICQNMFVGTDEGTDTFCYVSKSHLDSVSASCGLSLKKRCDVKFQFCESINYNNYENITCILEKDVISRDISLADLEALELNLTSLISSGAFTATRDLLPHVATLVIIRKVLDLEPYDVRNFAHILEKSQKNMDILQKVLRFIWRHLDMEEKRRIHTFLYELCGVFDCPATVLSAVEFSLEETSILTRKQKYSFLVKVNRIQEYENRLKECFGNPRLQKYAVESSLVKSYNPLELDFLVKKFVAFDDGKQIQSIKQWGNEGDVGNLCLHLPSSFLRDLCFIILAKVNDLVGNQSFEILSRLLQFVEDELKRQGKHSAAVVKFLHITSWESVYCKLLQMDENFPYKCHGDLISACKDCLTHQSHHLSQPRMQVVMECSLTLINATQWDFLVANRNAFSNKYAEFCAALSEVVMFLAMCAKPNGPKLASKDLWEYFTNFFATKSGADNVENYFGKCELMEFLVKLQEPYAVNAVISALCRLQTILKDDSAFELDFPYMNIWPSNISTYKSFVYQDLFEITATMVNSWLRREPQNVQILKFFSDLWFSANQWATSLKYDILTLLEGSEAFQKAITKCMDDSSYKKMIKCCVNLHCYTQAAILCQFLDDVDYALAFKCLSETTTLDSNECYYQYMWDVTLLEYAIYIHKQRKEYDKKQMAIKQIGLLELNMNNNEEIKREAANVRKIKFLQAMCKRYVNSSCVSHYT